jgi:DNA helicase II / ATP-dependent DNA helicase PcrA
MSNLLENLNQEQLKAVIHDQGPLLIVAGAGTGKTTAITQRIAYLIEQGKAGSEEILALTFTEKAAGEMEERVDQLLPIGYLDLWISTFHSFGEKILKEHGFEIGLPADFKLLNEFEQWILVNKNLDRFELDYYRPLGNPGKFVHSLIKHFSRAKDEDISPQDYLHFAEELKQNFDQMLGGKKGRKKIPEAFCQLLDEKGRLDKEIAVQEVARISEVANAYHVYQQVLLENSALDFGDLINYSIRLFKERPKVLAKYRQQFKYIMLDEFQDTNWAQYELVKMLSAPKNNLVVVGDDDQSIYKFRGASISNILQFKKDFPKAKEIFLKNNYRNRQNILDLAYDFIQLNNPNRLEYQLRNGNKSKISKKLLAHKEGKGRIEVIRGQDLDEEIRQIVEKIAELKIKGKCSWNDFGILVRANDSAKEICSFLEAAEIPYQFLASRGLYAKSVILDVVSYLKLLDNYHESSAVYRVLNLPIFDFSHQELVNFNYWSRKKAWSLFETLRNASNLKLGRELTSKIDEFLRLVSRHAEMSRRRSASEMILAFLHDSGYLKYLTSQNEKKSREQISYLNQFMKRAQAFEAGSDDRSVKAFLRELEMEIESGEEGNLTPDLDSGPESVKVMTVHSSKGLEFKFIFLANLVDKRFPTIERKDPIQLPEQLIKEELPEGNFHLEEERRLFYVAATRAQEGLFLSWGEDYGGVRKKKPSRFLIESGLEKKEKKDKICSASNILETKKKKSEKEKKELFKAPSFYSYSQLKAFSTCPYQYRFSFLLKIPCFGKPHFSFGKTMHSALQRTFELINERAGFGQATFFGKERAAAGEPLITLEEIYKLYNEKWVDEWYQSRKQKEEYYEKGRAILKEFFEKHNENWPRVLHMEKGFKNKIMIDQKAYTIGGTIDRIDELGDKIKIVDYKTGSPKEKLDFDDKFQLLIYQMAAKDIFRQEIKSLSFYFLENNTDIEFLGDDKDLEKVREKVSGIIREIEVGEFPAKPGPLCKYCDFKSICEFRKN